MKTIYFIDMLKGNLKYEVQFCPDCKIIPWCNDCSVVSFRRCWKLHHDINYSYYLLCSRHLTAWKCKLIVVPWQPILQETRGEG